MTWCAKLLRGADDLAVAWMEPVTSGGAIILRTVGETPTPSSNDVLAKLASSDTGIGIRLQQGRPLQIYDGSAWIDADPETYYGPMLVRSVAVTEHPDARDTFQVEYETSSFGPPQVAVGDGYNLLGTVNVSVSEVIRPKTVSAYRVNPNVPADSLATVAGGNPAAFDMADWRDGTDIAGNPVDVNTSPIGVPVDQIAVTVSFPTRFPYETWDGYDRFVNLYGGTQLIGSRNGVEFLKFPAGSLLWESADVQPLHHEFRMVTWSFLYDPWHHAIQVPRTLAQFATPTTIDSTTLMSQTTTVMWHQPFEDAFLVNTTADNVTIEDLIGSEMLLYLQQFEPS